VRVSAAWKDKGKATCSVETVDDMSLDFSALRPGVITVPGRFRTPEGIHAGASLAAVASRIPW